MRKKTEIISVSFIIDVFPCQGILNQEGNSFYLDVKSSFPTIFHKPPKITCYHEQQVFVLYNNQIHSRKLFPEFVVENYEKPFFSTFEFCLDGLQDFLSVSEFYEGKAFFEKVTINKVSYLCECVNDSEKTTVKITSPCQHVELDKINDIVLRFVQLFTLVSYKRVTCSSIHIIDDEKKYEFFSWRCKPFSGNKNRHYSLLHAGLIYSKGWWKNILNNYFEEKNEFFESCLNGYISQIDTGLFWQCKIICICGIWNWLGKKKINENISLYNGFCVLYKQSDVIFHVLFPGALTDFEMLKNARNEAAHGELTSRSQEEFDELYQAFRRIRLLTIVYIYQELGLPLIYICECIRNSFHDCVRDAELDKFVFAQVINDIPFFNVDENTWEYFSQPRIYSCFIYIPSKDMLKLDKTTTELAWNEHLRGDEPFYGNYVAKACPNCNEPVYQNSIFIICGSAHKEINGSFLLNYEDVPAEIKDKCEAQRTDLLLKRFKSK